MGVGGGGDWGDTRLAMILTERKPVNDIAAISYRILKSMFAG